MNKIICGIIFLSGYVLLCVSLASVAFKMHFLFGLIVTAIEMILTAVFIHNPKK